VTAHDEQCATVSEHTVDRELGQIGSGETRIHDHVRHGEHRGGDDQYEQFGTHQFSGQELADKAVTL
jgi:hypothetical protein